MGVSGAGGLGGVPGVGGVNRKKEKYIQEKTVTSKKIRRYQHRGSWKRLVSQDKSKNKRKDNFERLTLRSPTTN